MCIKCVSDRSSRDEVVLSSAARAAQARIDAEKRHSSLSMSSTAVDLFFPMHCVTIEDLLSFDKLHSHEEIEEMCKFVLPDENDERSIIFVSHQVFIHSFQIETLKQITMANI